MAMALATSPESKLDRFPIWCGGDVEEAEGPGGWPDKVTRIIAALSAALPGSRDPRAEEKVGNWCSNKDSRTPWPQPKEEDSR